MVTVSSAFISSRRERIIFRVLSAAGCAFKAAACVDVLRAVLGALGKTDLDNTDVARDHSFHCIASAESTAPAHIRHVVLTVSKDQPDRDFLDYITFSSCRPGSATGWTTNSVSCRSGRPRPGARDRPSSRRRIPVSG